MSSSPFSLPKQRPRRQQQNWRCNHDSEGYSECKLARRLVVRPSGVGLGAASFFADPGGSPNTSLPAFAVAHARGKTTSFAAIVEKLKPAVISDRVGVEGGREMVG